MTRAAAETNPSAHGTDESDGLTRLKALLARTADAYDLMAERCAPPAMLQMIRHSLGQIHVKLTEHYLAAGNVTDAIASGERANELQPGDRDTSLLFARALLAANDRGRALPLLEGAASTHGPDATIHALLAQVYLNSGRAVDAAGAFRRALALRPEDTTLMAAFANALAIAGDIGEALSVWRQVLAVNPDNADHLSRYAALCNDAGAFDEARAAFARLMVLQPGRGLNHRLFGKLRHYTVDDPHMTQMERLLRDAEPDGADAREFHFALFNAHDALADYDRAFDHLQSANDILRGQLRYRPAIFETLFANIEAAFDPANLPAIEQCQRDESPIFVVGMPRSGSTLVEQILDSHPDVSALGETPAFAALVEKHLLQPSLAYDLSPLADIRSLGVLGDAYLASVGKTTDGARRTVDKYLTNFLSIGVILSVFPKARIVHCQRNPLANCFSIYSSYFETTGLGFKADMAQIASYYVGYVQLMRFWKRLFGDAILDLSYEQLTLDQEAQTRRLIAYCGLDWNPACLDFHKNDRAVKTASYMQVRQPLYSGIDRRTAHYMQHLDPMLVVLQNAGLHPVGDAA